MYSMSGALGLEARSQDIKCTHLGRQSIEGSRLDAGHWENKERLKNASGTLVVQRAMDK